MEKYGIYVNSRFGGHMMPMPEDARRVQTFNTYIEAEIALRNRGYINSTSVDRDNNGKHLPTGKTTAYVVKGDPRFW